MSQSARARVNQHDDLIGGETHRPGCLLVVNLLDVLNFQKMIAAAQGPDLRTAPLFSPIRNLVGIGTSQGTPSFREFWVSRLAVAVVDHPLRALDQHAVQVAKIDFDETRTAHSAGHVSEDLVNELAQTEAHVLPAAVQTNQPHSAVDVEPHAAGGDHARRVIRRRHAANGETVTLVNIGHRQARADDSRQRGNVHRLLERFILGDLVDDLLCGIHHNVGAHPKAIVPRDAPAEVVDSFQSLGETHMSRKMRDSQRPSRSKTSMS